MTFGDGRGAQLGDTASESLRLSQANPILPFPLPVCVCISPSWNQSPDTKPRGNFTAYPGNPGQFPPPPTHAESFHSPVANQHPARRHAGQSKPTHVARANSATSPPGPQVRAVGVARGSARLSSPPPRAARCLLIGRDL